MDTASIFWLTGIAVLWGGAYAYFRHHQEKAENLLRRFQEREPEQAKPQLTRIKPKLLDQDNKENCLISIGNTRYLLVKDTSTGKKVFLRVPPNMRRVKQALAWTFNIEESEYQPRQET